MSNKIFSNNKEPHNLVVMVYGFDLFFEMADEDTLKEIVAYLGGNSSYDLADQKVTYMFEADRYVEFDGLGECQKVVDQAGHYLAEECNCFFKESELYVVISNDDLEKACRTIFPD